jgi:hypothetical protein
LTNFANASGFHSISKELENVTTRANPTSHSEISMAGKGGANLFALSGEVSAQTKYNVKNRDPLESCSASAKQQAGDKHC